jgi:S1-C subfamily serine protease
LPVLLALLWSPGAWAQDLEVLLKSEQERVAVIERIKPTVVAIFAAGGTNGGSGVLISDDGYALTNFHVVQATGPTPKCGLADGVLYDSVLVGLDKVGDVALIKLLPRKEGAKFPFSVMGNSDTVNEGEWSIAMGNPFLLATDFTPTVTFGLVSGVHRYQYPAGTFLEYTDCIQIETSINPGNSGGPLFSMKGELIGINGRGSFDKRGRVNSGVGYAISINQIKNFLGHLRSGIDTDHATIGASLTTQTDTSGIGQMQVTQILTDCDAYRRGLNLGDQILSFAGRKTNSVNQLKNVVGIYPRGWRMPLEYRSRTERKDTLVRLMGVQRKEIKGTTEAKIDPKKGPPMPPIKGMGAPSPAAKFYEPKAGFANYYFNRQERERLLAGFRKQGDFAMVNGDWSFEGTASLAKSTTENQTRLDIKGEGTKAVVTLTINAITYSLEPLNVKASEEKLLRKPDDSGGLLLALYVYRQLLVGGDKRFSDFDHGGIEPIYPPAQDEPGKPAASLISRRIDAEVANTRIGGYFLVKLFFSTVDQKLLAMEVRLSENEDPCEVYFSDYRAVDGRQLPQRMQVVYGNGSYGTFNFKNFNLQAK